jgi:hypothetical protein
MKLSPQNKAMIESYARSLVGTGIAAYTASGGDPKATLNAIWASLIPVALRFVNKKDGSFGLGAAK